MPGAIVWAWRPVAMGIGGDPWTYFGSSRQAGVASAVAVEARVAEIGGDFGPALISMVAAQVSGVSIGHEGEGRVD